MFFFLVPERIAVVLSIYEYFAFTNLDDIIIASSISDEHISHLTQLFQRLQLIGIIGSSENYMLGDSYVDFFECICSVFGEDKISCLIVGIIHHPGSTKAQLQPGKRRIVASAHPIG